jgi:hypothetical protein
MAEEWHGDCIGIAMPHPLMTDPMGAVYHCLPATLFDAAIIVKTFHFKLQCYGRQS